MNDLVPYGDGFLVPPERDYISQAYLIQPNELDYEGKTAVVLTKEALVVCTPPRQLDIIHLQSILRINIDDFRGTTFEEYYYGKRVIRAPSDTWGITIVHRGVASFEYELSFLTFLRDPANDWKRRIQQARAKYDRGLFG